MTQTCTTCGCSIGKCREAYTRDRFIHACVNEACPMFRVSVDAANQLEVTIAGPQGAGKTRLAAVITEWARANGFCVNHVDGDAAVSDPRPLYGRRDPMIRIVEVQTPSPAGTAA